MITGFNFNEALEEAMPIIEKMAPSVAAAIGGPFGIALTAFVNLINMFYAYPNNTFPAEFPTTFKPFVDKIINDEDSVDKLKKMEEDQGSWLTGLLKSYQKAEIDIKVEK